MRFVQFLILALNLFSHNRIILSRDRLNGKKQNRQHGDQWQLLHCNHLL
jgi:hypothetical protein